MWHVSPETVCTNLKNENKMKRGQRHDENKYWEKIIVKHPNQKPCSMHQGHVQVRGVWGFGMEEIKSEES